MADSKARKDFIESVIMHDLLDDAVMWIKNNMIPEHVFDKADLEEWAEENGYVKAESEL